MSKVIPARAVEIAEELAAAFRTDRDPAAVFDARTRFVDTLVATAAAEHLRGALHVPFSLAAVGGYGRRELFPFSDVDILVLFDNEADVPKAKQPVAEFVSVLWDAGLRVSQSIRTVSECCRLNPQNVELHISLLDLRFLAGDTDLFQKLDLLLPGFYRDHAATLAAHLSEMAQARHAKFNHTVYHLEPDAKESPGGIRDLHLLGWLSRLLPQRGPMSDSLAETAAARQFLHAVRCFLHFQSGRDKNLLDFESQDHAAANLPSVPLAPEAWMRIYYQHARRVFQSALRTLEFVEAQDPSLVRQFRDWRSRLSTSEFTVSRERVFLRNAAVTLSSAESLLQLLSFVARHGLALSWDTERRLRTEASSLAAIFQTQRVPWSLWRELLVQPRAALALRQMQETGVLEALIPEWRSVDGLVVRDFYHRYTVDEHTLVAMEVLDSLAVDGAEAPARMRELMLEEDDIAVLRLALLLHDLGKGTAPGDHVEGSLEVASAVLARLGTPDAQRRKITFLIEHHLDLSTVMTSRDLEDPATARYLSSRIGTQEDLRRLTLLTYADISAVNPTAMTPWRFEQLWRVYAVGLEQLTRELITHRIHDPEALSRELAASPEVVRFVDGLPIRYLRTHSPAEIEHHSALWQKSLRDGVAVEIRPDAGAYLLTVLTADQPGLFAALCGVLASFGMNIVKAEAAANAVGSVLDQFRFADPLRTLELNPEELNRLQWTVECVVRGSVNVADLLKRRRPSPRPSNGSRILPCVHFNDDASDTSTLIDFVGEDRPGLLYDLASALGRAGCDIDVVLVNTEAHKAIDVFYVTANGAKLDGDFEARLGPALESAAGSR